MPVILANCPHLMMAYRSLSAPSSWPWRPWLPRSTSVHIFLFIYTKALGGILRRVCLFFPSRILNSYFVLFPFGLVLRRLPTFCFRSCLFVGVSLWLMNLGSWLGGVGSVFSKHILNVMYEKETNTIRITRTTNAFENFFASN